MSDNHKDEEPRSNEEPRSDGSEHRGGNEYKVGRNQPPLHTRFPPGVSGNPGGRPRRAPLDITRQIQDIYLERVLVNVGGKKKWVPGITALAYRHFAQALMGDHKSTAVSFSLAREFGVFNFKEELELDFSDLTPEEDELCSRAVEILRRRKKFK